MDSKLLSAMLACDGKQICKHLVSLEPKDLKTLSKNVPVLIKEHLDFSGEGPADYNTLQSQRVWFRFVSLFGANKRELRDVAETFIWQGNGERLLPILDALVEVAPKLNWSQADELVSACLRKDEHAWLVAHRLVREGLAKTPDTQAWLMWMPDGMVGLMNLYKGPGSYLEKDPLALELVEQFFADPLVGTMPSKYARSNGCLHGVGGDVTDFDANDPREWEVARKNDIGLALIDLVRRGKKDEDEVRELFFNAIPFAASTNAGKWLGGLTDYVCNDDQLLLREKGDGVTVSSLLSHGNASVVKWAYGRLLPLAKSGRISLPDFAEAVAPAIAVCAKGTASSMLKTMVARLKKEPEAGKAVALAAIQALFQEDAKVQLLALDVIDKSEAVSDEKVQLELAEAAPIIKPTAREKFAELSGGGRVETQVVAESETAEPEAIFDPARPFAPIETVEEVIAELGQHFVSPQSFSTVLRIIDGMARTVGQTNSDTLQQLGAARPFLIDSLYQYGVIQREEGWEPTIELLQSIGVDTSEFKASGPEGAPDYDEKNSEANHELMWKLTKEAERDSYDQAGKAWKPILQKLLHTWLGGKTEPIECWISGEQLEKDKADYHKYAEEYGAPAPYYDPPDRPPFMRWCNDLRERIAAGNPFEILSTPTHEPSWVDPEVLADRVLAAESVSDVDLAMAILRLAPEGREAALAKVDGKTGAAAVLGYALGGKKPGKGKETEALACAEFVRNPPKFEANYQLITDGSYRNRGGTFYLKHPGHMVVLDIESLPDSKSKDHSFLPDYFYYFHPRRIFWWYDFQSGNRDCEPLLLEWFFGLNETRLELPITLTFSLLVALGESDNKYGKALAELLYPRLTGGGCNIPKVGYLALAYGMGHKAEALRTRTADALIEALGKPTFDHARLGRHLANFLGSGFYTINNPMKVAQVIAREGGAAAAGLARAIEGMFPLEGDSPRGLNKLIDVLVEIRTAQPGTPLPGAMVEWCEGQPAKGVLGKAIKAVLKTQ